MLIGFGFVGANKQKYKVDKQVQINKVNSIVSILLALSYPGHDP